MSSPLRWFRRHQKIMMVFFGVGLMGIFGLGSVASMINPGQIGQSAENPVVASWSGGKFTRIDLDAMRNHHYQMQRFLDGLRQYAADKKGDSFFTMAAPIRPLDGGQEYNQEIVDENAILVFLLAEESRKQGVVISDAMIQDYLSLVAGQVPISRDEMAAINKQINNTSALDTVFERLRMELAALQMQQFLEALPVYTSINPTEGMQLYARTARRVECRVLPISTDPATVTGEPAESELRQLYEAGKNRLANPNRLEPGFRVPRKVKVQYLVADFETFLQNEINQLTDKEVQDEYDRLVAAGDPMVMELVPEEPPVEEGPDLNAAETNDGEGDATTAGEKADGGSEATETEKTDESSDEKSGDGSESKDGSESESTGAGENEEGDNDQARVSLRQATRVGVMRQEEESGEQQEETGEQKEETGEQKQESGEQQEGTGAQKEGSGEQQEGTEQKTGSETGQTESSEQSNAEQQTGEQETVEGVMQEQEIQLPQLEEDPEPVYRPRPLKDVADQIKRRMVEPAATEKIQEAIRKANGELGDYRFLYQRWKFAPEAADDIPDPGVLDAEAIASLNGLQFRETGLVDSDQLREDPIGQQTVLRPLSFQGQRINWPVGVVENIFMDFDKLQLYMPTEAPAGGTVYLYWIAEKEESYIPDFAEARDEIVKYWRRQQAYEKAMEEAKGIVERLERSGQQLAEEYPDKSVPTGQFSWFNTLNRLDISSPPGISDADNELMQTIFSLKEGEIGFGPNGPRDSVYVVQMISPGQPPEELANSYLEDYFRFDQNPNDVTAAAGFYANNFARKWQEKFLEEYDFELVR